MDTSLPILRCPPPRLPAPPQPSPKFRPVLALSRAKHRSLTGHSKMSRWSRAWCRFTNSTSASSSPADGAPKDVAAQRQDGFFRLAGLYASRYARGRQMTAEAAEHISDLQFTETYRVPFQFSRLVREHLGTAPSCSRPPASPSPMSTATCPTTSPAPTASTSSATTSTRNASPRAEKRAHALGPCSAPTIPSSPRTSSGSARSPGSTKSRSTCPAPRP